MPVSCGVRRLVSCGVRPLAVFASFARGRHHRIPRGLPGAQTTIGSHTHVEPAPGYRPRAHEWPPYRGRSPRPTYSLPRCDNLTSGQGARATTPGASPQCRRCAQSRHPATCSATNLADAEALLRLARAPEHGRRPGGVGEPGGWVRAALRGPFMRGPRAGPPGRNPRHAVAGPGGHAASGGSTDLQPLLRQSLVAACRGRAGGAAQRTLPFAGPSGARHHMTAGPAVPVDRAPAPPKPGPLPPPHRGSHRTHQRRPDRRATDARFYLGDGAHW